MTEQELLEYHIMIPKTKSLKKIRIYLSMGYILLYKDTKYNHIVNVQEAYSGYYDPILVKNFRKNFESNRFKILFSRDIKNIESYPVINMGRNINKILASKNAKVICTTIMEII